MTPSIHAAVDQFRSNLRSLLDEAVQQHTEGLLKQAETSYRKVLLREPAQPEALNNLGVLLAETDRLGEALMVLRQAVSHSPANPDYLLNLGRVETVAGNRGAAERSYRGALEQDPGHAEAALTLGRLLEEAGGAAEAEAVYRSLLSHNPEKAEALLALARVTQTQGRPDEAETALQQAVAAAPELGEAHLRLGRLLLAQGRAEEAAGALADAVAVEPQAAEAHLALGEALTLLARPAAAARAFQAALEQAPDSVPACAGLIRALVADGRSAEASDLVAADAATPPELLVELGGARAEAGDAEGALAAYGQAISAAPADAAAYLRLGPLLRATGRQAEAERLFDYRSLLYWRRLPGVEGFASVEAFNAALAQILARRLAPNAGAGRLAPLRGGAEISGELFTGPRGPALEGFAATVTRHLQAYLAERKGLAGHPYFAAPPQTVELRGQGLRLPASAFVEAHAHPAAYLSGVYYLEVPPEVAESRDSIAGCLRFSDAPRPSDWSSFETLRPKPGLLVLFPSYLWHAAIPFNAPGDRLSIAFDLFASRPAPVKGTAALAGEPADERYQRRYVTG